VRKRKKYNRMDKRLKGILRTDKRDWANRLAQKSQEVARKGYLKGVYDATRKLCSDRLNKVDTKKNKDYELGYR